MPVDSIMLDIEESCGKPVVNSIMDTAVSVLEYEVQEQVAHAISFSQSGDYIKDIRIDLHEVANQATVIVLDDLIYGYMMRLDTEDSYDVEEKLTEFLRSYYVSSEVCLFFVENVLSQHKSVTIPITINSVENSIYVQDPEAFTEKAIHIPAL
jgi:hypothetical protein